MNKKQLLSTLKESMSKTIDSFKHELSGLRTDRASPSFVENVKVEAYNNISPLKTMSTITTSDVRTLTIQVWDTNLIKSTIKALQESNLGINPNVDGNNIRINFPPLSEERRKELIKIAKTISENNKITIRNIRRDGINKAKELEKSGIIPKDSSKGWTKPIQELTDEFVDKITKLTEERIKEIES